MDKVAIVILNWNGVHYLKEFLPALVSYSNYPGASLWVVDNCSTDESVSFLNEQYPQIKQIHFDENYGFALGYQKALRQIEAEYFVLLNSDVEVTPGWLEPVIHLMDNDEKTGACMPKMMSYNKKDHFEYAGAAGGYIDKFGYPFCRGRILSYIEKDLGQYNDTREVFWASGACMFVRSEAYFKAGELDADFFAHMEEIDLCWRLKNCGYKIMYTSESTVFHVGGGTLPNNNPRKLYYNYRNNLFLLYKNLPQGTLFYTLFRRMLLDGISSSIYLLRFSFSFFFAVFRAHLSFYRSLGKLRKKRKLNRIMNGKKLDVHIFPESIVFNFLLKKRRTYDQLDFHPE